MSAEAFGTLGMRSAMEALDGTMARNGVSAEVRDVVVNSADMMYEYIPYAIEQRKDPTDGKVLAAFLATKTGHIAKYLGHEGLNCGIAIVEFVMSVNTAWASTSTGFPPAIVTAWGLATLNLIDVGNSCEFAQRAYYEAFIRESAVKLAPIRVRAKQYYSDEKHMCLKP